jgi:putative ABC transport system permease protein
MTQIAFSFVLLAGAGMLLATLVSVQTANNGYNMRQVLALDVPTPTLGLLTRQEMDFYQEMTRGVAELPGVQGVAIGNFVPWRDAGSFGSPSFAVEGYTPENGEEDPHARFRVVSPGFFAVLGVPLVAGRNFTAEDRRGNELVVVVSESVAQRLFPNGSALNRKMWWTDAYFGRLLQPRRIIGVVADVDDENVVPGPAPTIYHPVMQVGVAGRLFVHAAGDPYALVAPVRRIIRDLSANQPVERAATLQTVRAEALAPARLNAFVVSGFAGIALLIAAVGVSGVLAFSVSARTREFGVRVALGSTPRHLLVTVLSEGVLIVAIGILAGAAGAYLFGRLGASYVETLRLPGVLPMLGAAAVLIVAALLASLMPASRASRVDVLQALRSE